MLPCVPRKMRMNIKDIVEKRPAQLSYLSSVFLPPKSSLLPPALGWQRVVAVQSGEQLAGGQCGAQERCCLSLIISVEEQHIGLCWYNPGIVTRGHYTVHTQNVLYHFQNADFRCFISLWPLWDRELACFGLKDEMCEMCWRPFLVFCSGRGVQQ